MDTWPLLLLCAIIIVTNVIKLVFMVRDHKLQKVRNKQLAKTNYLLLKQHRSTQSNILQKRAITSTPITQEPGERRRSG